MQQGPPSRVPLIDILLSTREKELKLSRPMQLTSAHREAFTQTTLGGSNPGVNVPSVLPRLRLRGTALGLQPLLSRPCTP